MSDIGINLSLNTGNAVSNVNALSSSFDSLGRAVKKAVESGNAADAKAYGELALKLRQQMVSEAKVGGGRVEAQSPAMRIVQGTATFFNRGAGSIAAAGGGNAAGAALGAAGDAAGLIGTLKGILPGAGVAAGVAAAFVGLGVVANKLSEQYEKVMQPAMDLAATLGTLGTDSKKNSIAFSDALNRSAKEAMKYGYTMEEGMGTVKELARLGVGSTESRGMSTLAAKSGITEADLAKFAKLGASGVSGETAAKFAKSGITEADLAEASKRESKAFKSAGRVFEFERATGADRGVLTQAEAYGQRYAAGDALAFANGGVEQSGMEPGQYQEYLNATLRIFEEGLSRGVVKGFGEVTRTQNMLAAVGTTWKGEQGAQRYSQMSSAVEKAGELTTDYDVVMYQAIKATLADAAVGGNKAAAAKAKPEDSKAIAAGAAIDKKYQGYGNAGEYLSVLKAGDAGLTPEILARAMESIKKDLAGGDKDEAILAMMKVFNLTATAASQLYEAWDGKKLKDAVAIASDPKNKVEGTPEMKLLEAVNGIRLDLVNAGSAVLPAKASVMSFLQSLTSYFGGSKKLEADKAMSQAVIGGMLPTAADPKTQVVQGMKAALASNDTQAGQAALAAIANASAALTLYVAAHPQKQKELFAGVTDKGAGFAAIPGRLGELEKPPATGGSPKYDSRYAEAQVAQLGLGEGLGLQVQRGEEHAVALVGMIKEFFGNEMDMWEALPMKKAIMEAYGKASSGGVDDGEWHNGVFSAALGNLPTQSDKDRYKMSERSDANRELAGRIFYKPDTGTAEYPFEGGRKEATDALGKGVWDGFRKKYADNYDKVDPAFLRDLFEKAQKSDTSGGPMITTEELKDIIKAFTTELSTVSRAFSEGGPVVTALSRAARTNVTVVAS